MGQRGQRVHQDHEEKQVREGQRDHRGQGHLWEMQGRMGHRGQQVHGHHEERQVLEVQRGHLGGRDRLVRRGLEHHEEMRDRMGHQLLLLQ